MALVVEAGLDHVAYILILYSLAFLLFLFVCMLVHLYDRSANPVVLAKDGESLGAMANGHARRGRGGSAGLDEHRRVRDAEEFELEGLMSDEDDDEQQRGRRRGDGEADAMLASPGR